MWLFALVSYLSLYLLVVFGALCVATGLYYLNELAEDYSALTKVVISGAIKVICVLLGLLWLLDDVPFLYMLVGLGSHVLYSFLLDGFPFVHVRQVKFVLSAVMFALNHFVWYRYFSSPYVPDYSFTQIICFFFAFVWLVPFSFFVSLTLPEWTLPVSGGKVMGGEGSESSSAPHEVLSGGRQKTKIIQVVKNLFVKLQLEVRHLVYSFIRN
eukprot:TRINITY_DN293_c0_g4_i1.p1 TRINITY_DN293_c0_g4~~TRINITY_DN293_c0_g4_i1.p1  ORF type:complete len:212 (-),score=40.23 TRINITY_DN293_c0_g4_i1:269-904(-)